MSPSFFMCGVTNHSTITIMTDAVKRLKQKTVRDFRQLQTVEKALLQHDRVDKIQKKMNDALARAKRNLSRQQEVTANHMCGIFRDALETRQVIPRGARLPNGQGKPRRLYRESCENPGTTPLKRMRCARACCRSYGHSPGFRARSISRGSKNAMCSGVTCKIKRRPPGSKGKSTFLGRAVNAGKRPRSSASDRPASDRPAGSPASAGQEGKRASRASRGSPAPKRPRTAAAATPKRARTAPAATPKRARTAARTAAKSPPRTRKAQSKAQSKSKAKL